MGKVDDTHSATPDFTNERIRADLRTGAFVEQFVPCRDASGGGCF